jgi:hypothetical protein
MDTIFFMGECRCEDIYIFSGVIFFFISNSVYCESGKIKRGKTGCFPGHATRLILYFASV